MLLISIYFRVPIQFSFSLSWICLLAMGFVIGLFDVVVDENLNFSGTAIFVVALNGVNICSHIEIGARCH